MVTVSARLLLAALLLGLGAAAGPTVARAAPPPTLDADGRQLRLQGSGTRTVWFTDVYSVALYLSQPASRTAQVLAPERAKAFRVEVLYDGTMPDRPPASWRDELLPVLGRDQEEKLRSAYEGLRRGDRIVVRYAPAAGTTVTVAGRRLLFETGHRLMDAFVHLWLGDHPVSDDLRRALLAGSP